MGFAEKVAAMSGGYLERTGERLQSLVQQVDEGSLDYGEAHRTFHDIVGTAPMFGFAALGEQAKGAEDEAIARADGSVLRSMAQDLLKLVAEARPA